MANITTPTFNDPGGIQRWAKGVVLLNADGTPYTPVAAVNKGGASIFTSQVAVTTAATLVAAARTGRQKISISSTSAVVFYVGPSGVTAANGFYVAAAAGATVTLDTAAAVYAIGAAAVTLTVIETVV